MQAVAAIVASFQTTHLHPDCIDYLQNLLNRYDQVVAVLSISQVKGSMKKPLDYPTRVAMLKKELPSLQIVSIAEARADNVWSNQLDQLLAEEFPLAKIDIFSGPDLTYNSYLGKNLIHEIPQHIFFGQEISKDANNFVLDTVDFRKGVVYGYSNLYPTVNATVDIAVFQNEKTELLLGRRNIEGKWRLPGGFSDPGDENFENAALRELQEECGDLEVGEMQYEKSFKVNDWRFRLETTKIITLLFSTDIFSGNAKGNDDIDEVKFFPLIVIQKMRYKGEVVEEHYPLVDFLLKKYLK